MNKKISDFPTIDIAVKEIHQRTEAIARLWKHFNFTIDHIESILDAHQGNVSMAFESLNNFVRFGGATVLPTIIIDEAHVEFDVTKSQAMILDVVALSFAPCNNNLPDPLPVNDQCMGGLKFHCLECGCLVNWVDRHGTCTECLPF